jgi:hypothetical protein
VSAPGRRYLSLVLQHLEGRYSPIVASSYGDTLMQRQRSRVLPSAGARGSSRSAEGRLHRPEAAFVRAHVTRHSARYHCAIGFKSKARLGGCLAATRGNPNEQAKRTQLSRSWLSAGDNQEDLANRGLADGDQIEIPGLLGDEESHSIGGLTAVAYDIPSGSIAGYYPEMNPVMSLSHFDPQTGTPSYKGVPVTVTQAAGIPISSSVI